MSEEYGKSTVLIVWLVVVILLIAIMSTLTSISISHWVGMTVIILLVILGFVVPKVKASSK
ncbi:MAG: hypothetical protein RMJ31_03930 [Nitrososphaerota archaeon]|nr:hypothetical protein [Nitrososphaerales archaeon]MDW8044906.1 hypothetical protein [Nitrososphaerota archaeon]